MNMRRNHSPAISAAKAGFSMAAAYRFEKDSRYPAKNSRAESDGGPIRSPASGIAKSSPC